MNSKLKLSLHLQINLTNGATREFPFIPLDIYRFKHKFGEGNGTPLQYSCLENPMGGGAW